MPNLSPETLQTLAVAVKYVMAFLAIAGFIIAYGQPEEK